jgi:hypothetical protein
MKAHYYDFLDKEKNLWGNCACSLRINPYTCGKQSDCEGCKNIVKEYYDKIMERLSHKK